MQSSTSLSSLSSTTSSNSSTYGSRTILDVRDLHSAAPRCRASIVAFLDNDQTLFSPRSSSPPPPPPPRRRRSHLPSSKQQQVNEQMSSSSFALVSHQLHHHSLYPFKPNYPVLQFENISSANSVALIDYFSFSTIMNVNVVVDSPCNRVVFVILYETKQRCGSIKE